MAVTTGRRTRIVAGREADYERIHATIPGPVEEALRASGVIRWHIWRDGQSLFHSIETVAGYENMVAHITALGPIDAAWDELIGTLLSSEPSDDIVLPLVWSMDQARVE